MIRKCGYQVKTESTGARWNAAEDIQATDNGSLDWGVGNKDVRKLKEFQ